jgi:hypothetical protein
MGLPLCKAVGRISHVLILLSRHSDTPRKLCHTDAVTLTEGCMSTHIDETMQQTLQVEGRKLSPDRPQEPEEKGQECGDFHGCKTANCYCYHNGLR